jgi:hypothetical protein
MFMMPHKSRQEPLRLEDLVSYDNIATGALVDHVCYAAHSVKGRLTDIAILLDNLTQDRHVY